MKRIFLFAGLIFLCCLLIRIFSQPNQPAQNFQQLYIKAEELFNGAATDSTDSVAMQYYTQIVQQLKPSSANASLLYNCYERIGILQQGLGFSSNKILQNYYTALSVQHNYHLNDSVLFRLLLSVGNMHYANALFDSSVYYFSKAENIINTYPAAGLAGDLYNSIGALYSEAGNYVQSGIYFNKALEITKRTRPNLKEAIFAMSANVASSVKLSGYQDSALRLYKSLLNVNEPSFPIINNIAGIYLTKKNADSALLFLKLLKNIQGNDAVGLHNATAQAFMLKNDTAKALQQLNYALQLFDAGNQQKNNFHAATYKYMGDLFMMKDAPQQALSFYQKAIIQYDYAFNNNNAFANPGNFVGDFASYNLFDALNAKAHCFASLYNNNKQENYLNATINTYDSAFVLADYIKKSIDNDEARLFIADKVFTAYIKAVDFLLGTKSDEVTVTKALQWISKSRATSLAISLKENTIKQYAGLPDSLLEKEKNLKLNISRLKLQLQQSTDSATQSTLISQINTADVSLQSLNNVFKTFPAYYRQKFAADSFNISSIQKNILKSSTAVICYFKGSNFIHAFTVKKDKIFVNEIKYDSAFENNISVFAQELAANNAGKSYNSQPSKYLYKSLIETLSINLANVKSLIIIPDKELINIPFEAFLTNDNKFLIEDYDITYQYALPFLQEDESSFNNDNAIAFAPFAHSNNNTDFSVLSSSPNEVSNFKNKFEDVNATKQKFLNTAVNTSAIHLATHAAANYVTPADSYIAFYPSNKTDSSYKVYAHELYNISLPKTKLVFLSACETGSGKISQSEGALSLSRAFAFAGCPNIITSLWKAEDVSTAYISKKFYEYASKNYTYAKALQQAKIDLLHDPDMSQFHSPQYWSHLIFIGDVQEKKSFGWPWILVSIFSTIVFVFVVRKKKSTRLFYASYLK